MAPRFDPIKTGRKHARALPSFEDEESAKAFFFDWLLGVRERLDSLAPAALLPSQNLTEEGLRKLEDWAAALTPEHLNVLATTRGELDHLLTWHAAAIAVRCVPHARWVVRENNYIRGRWNLGVNHGLATWFFGLDYREDEPAPKRRRKPEPHRWSTWIEQLREHLQSDPTLHPAVLASADRLSADPSLRTCQTFVLKRGVDAFDEPSLRSALRSTRSIEQLEVLRCFEIFPALEDETMEALQQIIPEFGAWACWPISLLVRHRPALGLELARRFRDQIHEYTCAPLVGAIVSIPDLGASDILSDVVAKITAREHPLWQMGETFALAVSHLWDAARAGDEQAQAALKMVGRRWKRIPPETHAELRKRAPRFTREIALAGGVTKKQSGKSRDRK